jgi:hypothetical protein
MQQASSTDPKKTIQQDIFLSQDQMVGKLQEAIKS